MAAPAYKWEFVYDLWGDRVPKIATMRATANLETKVGTLLKSASTRAALAGNSTASILGLAAEATDGSTDKSEDDPMRVYILAEGMVIRGTADDDASALQGLAQKRVDLNDTGTLDVADTTNGCLAVLRAFGTDSKTVDCLVTGFDMGSPR